MISAKTFEFHLQGKVIVRTLHFEHSEQSMNREKKTPTTASTTAKTDLQEASHIKPLKPGQQ